MSLDPNESAIATDELSPPLRTAVERIVERRVPEDALGRALYRARKPKRLSPTPTQPAGRRKTFWRRMAVGTVAAAWLGAALLIAVEDARYDARRAQAQNNLRQIGLAVHNYHDVSKLLLADSTRRYASEFVEGRTPPHWFASRFDQPALVRDITDGTSNTAIAGEKQRVIHSAEMSLVVKDVLDLESKLRALVRQFKGYTSEAQVSEPQQSERSGRWVVRIPVDSFDAFLEAVAELGIPEYRLANAQDVTEEYVDVEARIANKKQLEKRLLELLEKREGDLEDVIAVEKQLNQVRGEIEQSEGRRKYLENRTELASAAIVAREERQYVSPRARTFSSEIGLAWSTSFDALARFGKGLVLAAVAVGPWLPAVLVLLYLTVRGIKRLRSARAGSAQ